MDDGSIRDGLRQMLRALVRPVAIVTAGAGEDAHAMAVTAFCEVSLDPPTLLVCVNAAAGLAPLLADGADFTLNVVDQRHEDACRACVTASGRARLSDPAWRVGPTGVPVLTDALAVVQCRQTVRHDHGTHMVLIAEVTALHRGEPHPPLAYHDGALLRVAVPIREEAR